tara:strand:- start:39 stop:284 length:246 start_codon:yes stop_codon:yes gene_type:complete
MGTKTIHVGELSALPLLYNIIESEDGRSVLTAALLANLSTAGSGDFGDVGDLSYLMHELIQYCVQLNQQDYDGINRIIGIE